MTWEELGTHIGDMDDEQRNTDVTVFLQESTEYLPVEDIKQADMSTMVLDNNHPFLTICF